MFAGLIAGALLVCLVLCGVAGFINQVSPKEDA